MKHTFIILVFFCVFLSLISLQGVESAKIRGAIYDHELNPISKTVVTINSTPEQRRVSQYGGYHFIVSPGSYEIVATLTRNDITREIAREYIVIPSEGDYVKDLFLYDDFDMRSEFEETFFMRVTMWFNEYYGFIILLFVGLLFIWVAFNVYFRFFQVQKHHTQTEVGDTQDTISEIILEQTSDDIIEKKILSLLADSQKPLRQKDIRKKFPLSEAKISLVLRNMEEKGQIARLKKGRSNVISLT